MKLAHAMREPVFTTKNRVFWAGVLLPGLFPVLHRRGCTALGDCQCGWPFPAELPYTCGLRDSGNLGVFRFGGFCPRLFFLYRPFLPAELTPQARRLRRSENH